VHPSTATPDVKPSPVTQTETPAPTATPDLTFNIIDDYMVIQRGNDSPAYILQNVPSQELADNHTGIWWGQYGEYQDSNFVYTNGFTRLRIGSLYDWSGDDQGWPLNEDTLLPRVDDKITEYAENGIAIVLTTHMLSTVPPIIQEFTQEDIDTILESTAFVVEHFKGRIAYYEIYNEFGNTPKVHTYANLVEQSAALIKEIDPEAKVIFGSIPGDQLAGEDGYGEYYRNVMNEDYMWALIDAVDFSQIDGFTLHPFYDNIPVDERIQNYPLMVAEMKARLAAKGFTGEYFADEILWHTWDEPDFPHGPPVSKTIAAKYYLRSITDHRGLDFNVTINTFFQEPEMDAIRNLNNVLAGAEPTDAVEFTLETSEEVQYLRQYAFTLPKGDILVAVWRNGPAAEEDIGILSTLTLADVSASSVTGINVFDGFEQELVAETIDNNLVIHDLLVKDYPIFIKIVGDSP
jgi:hypothetical protein